MAALDDMEDHLRHLGLGQDAAADPVKKRTNTAATTSAAYMTSIRSAKEERRKLRVEKDFRQYMSTQQEAKSTLALLEGVEAQAARAAVVAGAEAVLQAETQAAAAAVKEQDTQSAMRALQANEVSQHQEQERLILAARKAAATVAAAAACADSHDTERRHHVTVPAALQGSAAPKGTDTSTCASTLLLQSTESSPRYHQSQGTATDLCGGIAAGLVELAIRVSDNRFLPETTTDIAGRPVRRTDQDLPVTVWRQWVSQCVWDPIQGMTDTPRSDRRAGEEDGAPCGSLADRSMRRSRQPSHGGLAGAHPDDAEGGAAGGDTAVAREEEARAHLTFAAAQQLKYEAALGHEGVALCFSHLRAEAERLCKAAVEDIRRASDAHAEDAVTCDAAHPMDAEEVCPGWAQRMPPAGCFIFGDELSGSRLLCETVEKAFLAATHGAGGPGGGMGSFRINRRGSQYSDAAAGAVALTPASTSANKNGADSRRPSVHHSQSPQPQSTGVTRVENGVQRMYLTPRTLLNNFPAGGFSGIGGLARGHSGGRTRTAVVKGGVAGAGGSGTTGTAGAPGSGGASTAATGSAGARRTSDETEDHKEHEALAEALCRELVAVHVHNLHVATQGRVPGSLADIHAANAAMATAMNTGATSAAGSGSAHEKTPHKRGGGGSMTAAAAAAAPAPSDGQKHGSGKRDNSPGRPSAATAPITVAVPHVSSGQDEGDEAASPLAGPTTMHHTLSMVGFPQSESFYQLLQQRLAAAVDGAEQAILLHQAYRRLADEAAAAQQQQQQQQQQGNTGGFSTTQHTQRTKSATQPPSQAASASANVKGKGGSNGKTGGTVDSTPSVRATAVAEALRRCTFFPPLCVVGCFLAYDLTERRRRLSGSYVRRSSAGVALVTAASPNPPLFHDVYSPEGIFGTSGNKIGHGSGAVTASAGSSSAATTTTTASPVSMAGIVAAQSFTRKAAALDFASATTSVGGCTTTTTSTGDDTRTRRLESMGRLPVERVREELVSQHARWACWPAQWESTFLDTVALHKSLQLGENSVSEVATAAAAGLGGATAPTTAPGATPSSSARDSKSKRRRTTPTLELKENLGPTQLPPLQQQQQQASSGAVESAVTFPKVLFFTRTCVSPAYDEGDGDATPTSGAHGSSLYTFHGSDAALDADRARMVRQLCSAISAATMPSLTLRVFTTESLAPRQLLSPLRLGDYRRSPQVCAALIATQRAYAALFPRHERDATLSCDSAENDNMPSSCDRTPSLLASMEVFRAFNIYVYELYRIVAHDVFPPALWGCGAGSAQDAAASQKVELTSTMHFNSIDGSYERAKGRVAVLHSDFQGHLQQRCMVWWLHTLEAALEATAAALTTLVAEIRTTTTTVPHSVHGDKTTVEGEDAGALFLRRVRRLNETEKEELAALVLMGQDGGDTESSFALRLCAMHDSYVADVKVVATDVLRSSFAELFPITTTTTTVDLSQQQEDGVASPCMSPVPVAQLNWHTLAPALADHILGKVFAQPGSSLHGDQSGGSGVSPFLAQYAVLMQELVSAFHASGRRTEAWLHTMYGVALQVPPGGAFPESGLRPTTILQFFDRLPTSGTTPSTTTTTTTETATGSGEWTMTDSPSHHERCGEVSLGQRVNLMTYLANLSLYGTPTLTEDRFLHVHVLTLLQHLWEYLADTSEELAAMVGAVAPAVLPYPTARAAEDEAGGETPSSVWMHRYFSLCPCRPQANWPGGEADGSNEPPPFFSREEMRQLFRRHANPHTGLLPLRQFLLSVLLRRCCFCDGDAVTCPWQQMWSVPPPTARELRRAFASLPVCVRGQRGEESSPHRAGLVAGSVEGPVAQQWAAVRWWWWPLNSAAVQATGPVWCCDSSLPWSLLQALTTRFRLGRAGCLSAAYPALPEVLQALAPPTDRFAAAATTLERIFHAVAALRQTAEEEPAQGNFKPADVDAVALSPEEFSFYFSAFTRASKNAAGHSKDISLVDDARLLLLQLALTSQGGARSEAKSGGVTLPALLATHWGRSLVAAHFL